MNALGTAKHPERIYFGIFYHDTSKKFENIERFKNLNCTKFSYPGMLGVGFSRAMANGFYNNEDYYLQIDAHTIFDNWWDHRLITELEEIRNSVDNVKPVISFYLPHWIRNDDRTISLDKDYVLQQTLVWDYDHMKNEYSDIPIMKTERVEWEKEKHPFKRHYGISAHFIFADGSFCRDFVPDHQILFYGEEPTLALRVFAAKYSVYVTKKAHLWHKNKMLSSNKNNDRIEFKPDKDVAAKYLTRKAHGLNKTKDILTGKYLGYWGADSLETLQQYQNEANISFPGFYKNMENISDGKLWYVLR